MIWNLGSTKDLGVLLGFLCLPVLTSLLARVSLRYKCLHGQTCSESLGNLLYSVNESLKQRQEEASAVFLGRVAGSTGNANITPAQGIRKLEGSGSGRRQGGDSSGDDDERILRGWVSPSLFFCLPFYSVASSGPLTGLEASAPPDAPSLLADVPFLASRQGILSSLQMPGRLRQLACSEA